MNITHEFWDFIEKYYPNYHTCDNILYHSNLKLFIDGHESTIGEEMTVDEAEDELNALFLSIMDKAIEAYTKGFGIECGYCNSEQGAYCSHCGKLLPQNQNTEELKANYIEEIKSIINQYGEFSTACVMAGSSPVVKDEAYTIQLAEQSGADKVTLVTYSKETDQEMGEEDVPYEKLSIKVLADIHSLAIQWKEENESLRP